MPPFVGNERAVAAIDRAVAGGSPQHAYLFAGPERVGKATQALRVVAGTKGGTIRLDRDAP